MCSRHRLNFALDFRLRRTYDQPASTLALSSTQEDRVPLSGPLRNLPSEGLPSGGAHDRLEGRRMRQSSEAHA